MIRARMGVSFGIGLIVLISTLVTCQRFDGEDDLDLGLWDGTEDETLRQDTNFFSFLCDNYELILNNEKVDCSTIELSPKPTWNDDLVFDHGIQKRGADDEVEGSGDEGPLPEPQPVETPPLEPESKADEDTEAKEFDAGALSENKEEDESIVVSDKAAEVSENDPNQADGQKEQSAEAEDNPLEGGQEQTAADNEKPKDETPELAVDVKAPTVDEEVVVNDAEESDNAKENQEGSEGGNPEDTQADGEGESPAAQEAQEDTQAGGEGESPVAQDDTQAGGEGESPAAQEAQEDTQAGGEGESPVAQDNTQAGGEGESPVAEEAHEDTKAGGEGESPVAEEAQDDTQAGGDGKSPAAQDKTPDETQAGDEEKVPKDTQAGTEDGENNAEDGAKADEGQEEPPSDGGKVVAEEQGVQDADQPVDKKENTQEGSEGGSPVVESENPAEGEKAGESDPATKQEEKPADLSPFAVASLDTSKNEQQGGETSRLDTTPHPLEDTNKAGEPTTAQPIKESESLDDKQSGSAVLDKEPRVADASPVEGSDTEKHLSALSASSENKDSSEQATAGESAENVSNRSKDATILVALFVVVLVIGAAAFTHHFIKKRKQKATEQVNGVRNGDIESGKPQGDVEQGVEMKPLLNSKEKPIIVKEFSDTKKEVEA